MELMQKYLLLNFIFIFKIIKSNPKKFLTKDQLTKDKFRAISDFISGMTDRYAINLYNNFK
jgi:dGTPase